MNQDEINRTEWEKPDNWFGPDWAAVYHSRLDSRTWVPKKLTWMGWTLNFGKRAGWYWLAGILIAVLSLFVFVAYGFSILIP